MRRIVAKKQAQNQGNSKLSYVEKRYPSPPRCSVFLGFLLAILLSITLATYWLTILDLLNEWYTNDDYSSCSLALVVVIFLLFRNRKTLSKFRMEPCWWGGVALIVVAHCARISGLLFARGSLERYSLVLVVMGLVLFIAGWKMFRHVFWVLMFLFLMVPLPGKVHNFISPPLQRFATSGSVFFLEVFGVKLSQQGNVVELNGSMQIAVAEACSGLRMLAAFIIVAAFIAFMINRPRWQKVVLLCSSIPVAVVCNMIRIFLTAVLMLNWDAELAHKFFHDFAGYVMMPAAVMLLFGELWLMDRVVVSDSDTKTEDNVVVRKRVISRA